MIWLDYVLLGAVLGGCLLVLLRKKKKHGCCGDCSACGNLCGKSDNR